MQANLDKALSLVLASEGAEVNRSPDEPGGISKYGVSLSAYADFCKASGLPVPKADDIANLEESGARAFYTTRFASPIRFNDLPGGVDYRLLDIEINLGPTGGINALELALGRWPLTGIVSDDLIARVEQLDARILITALSATWISTKHASPGWKQYGHGWSNRNNRATADALAIVGG